MLKRYYVMGHYSKYVPIGSKRIKASSIDNFNLANLDISAFKTPDGKLVLVAINSGKERTIKLKGLDGYQNAVQIKTDANVDWEQTNMSFSGKVTLPKKSAVTLIFG